MNNMPRGAFSSQEKVPSGYKKFSINQFTPEQIELFKDMFQHLGPDSFLSKLAGGDQSAFEEMEAPALQQFNALQGNLASRFSGMGTGGRHSSGFQNTVNQAAQDFAGQLQANRMTLRNQAIRDLMGMSNQLLNQRPQEKGLVQKNQDNSSGWGGLIGAGVGGLGGFFAGGPAGALAGSQMGYNVGSKF